MRKILIGVEDSFQYNELKARLKFRAVDFPALGEIKIMVDQMPGYPITMSFLIYQEVAATNCVALFGMWYDLPTQSFFLTKADEVSGIYLFSLMELVVLVSGRGYVPADANEIILDYKVTGDLETFVNRMFLDRDPRLDDDRITYLRYLLDDDAFRANNERYTTEDKMKFLEKVFIDLTEIKRGLMRGAAGDHGDLTVAWTNMVSSFISRTVGLGHFSRGGRRGYVDMYEVSCASVTPVGRPAIEGLRAAQLHEVLIAESKMEGGAFYSESTDITQSPTLGRMVESDREEVIRNYRALGIGANDTIRRVEGVRGERGIEVSTERLTRVMRTVARTIEGYERRTKR